MKKALVAFILMGLFIAAALTGCAQTPGANAADKAIAIMNKMADRLGKVQTKADLEAAKGDLKAMANELKILEPELEKLAQSKTDATLEKKYVKPMNEAQQRMGHEMERITKAIGPDAMSELDDTLMPN